MAACGSCGSENPDGFRFCGHCGSNLRVVTCPSCGQANGQDQAFCGQCGASLDASIVGAQSGEPNGPDRPSLVGHAPVLHSPADHTHDSFPEDNHLGQIPVGLEERKLATVLFADVVGFTSLADRTDHEVVARMVDTAFQTAQ